jgi:hypothetical protein
MIIENQQAQNLESLFDGANVAHLEKRFDLTSIHERHTRIREICKIKIGGTFCDSFLKHCCGCVHFKKNSMACDFCELPQ